MFKVNIPNVLASVYAAASHTHGNITNDGKVGSTANKPLITGTNGAVSAGSFEGTATNIKMNGTQSAGSLNTFARGDHVHPTDTSRAASSHTHGNITNDGKVGTTTGKPLITTTGGAVTTGSFGSSTSTSATEFVACNDSRLSNARTPTSHTHGNLTNDGKVGSASGKILTTGTNGVIQASDSISKSQISDFPTSMTPSSHNQATTTITNSETYSNLGSNLTNQKLINDAINTKIGSLLSIELVTVVTSLGTASASTMNKLYLVAESSSKTNDAYEIYVTVRTGTSSNYSYAWEKVDTARIDLSGYSTTSHTHGNITKDGKVGTAANKPLITTTNGAVTTGSFGSSSSTSATEFVACNDSRLSNARTPTSHNQAVTTITNDQAYNNIKAGESTTLTLTTQKLINDAINTKLASKVDTVSGKGLSTNDFNATYKGYVDNLVSSTATTKNAHVHGSITSDGKLGSASGKILTTGTNGVIQASDSITKSQISDFPTSMTPSSHNQATTTITNNQAYNNIKAGESTTLTLTTQKLINDAINTKLASKVDTVSGKGLSTNDFNATYKGYVDNLVSSTATTKNAHVHGNITSDGKVGSASGKILTTGTSGAVQASDSITKSQISDFPSSMTPSSHTHGNITNDGKVGTAANKPLITTTNGAVTTGSFGSSTSTSATEFVACNDSRLSNARTPTSHNQAVTTITNDQAYNNIKAGESTTLTLTTQKLINDAINTKLGSKVDTVSGKGLSTNDFNATYKGYVDNLVSSTATTKNAHVHGNIGSGGTVTATTTTATNKIATIGASDNKIYSFTMSYTNGVLNIGG